MEAAHKFELGRGLLPAAVVLGLLLLVVSWQPVRGQAELEAPSAGRTGGEPTRLLDWQLERLINGALEDGLRKRSGNPQLDSTAIGRATSGAAMQRLLETVPRPSQRSTNGWPSERRSLQQAAGLAPKFQAGALDTLDQLSAILEGDNLSRLGRAFKPRTMSTARGFGKRSNVAPKASGFD